MYADADLSSKNEYLHVFDPRNSFIYITTFKPTKRTILPKRKKNGDQKHVRRRWSEYAPTSLRPPYLFD